MHCQSNFNLNLLPGALIAHASGGLNNKIYLNSEESFQHAYKNGYKFFEIDLNLTSDGIFVGIHSWDDWKRENKIKEIISIPSYEEIVTINKKAKYKIITEDFINNIMKKYPEIILVTDKVKDYDLLAKKIPFFKRMLVEVFDEKGLNDALNAGFYFPMPSYLHNPKDILNLIKNSDIRYFAIHTATFKNSFNTNIMKNLVLNGACISLYSSNISEFAENFFELGGFAIYSDFIPQDNFNYSCKGNWCKTY